MQHQKKADTLAHSAVEIPGYVRVMTDEERLPLPPTLSQTHPHIQLQVALRHISMLELLEWMYTEHRRVEPDTPKYPRLKNKDVDEAFKQLRAASVDDAAYLISVLNRAMYMCAHFMIENKGNEMDDVITLEGLHMIADFFQKMYQKGII